MLIKIHQTQYTIGDFESTKQHLIAALKSPAEETTIHVFPELFISGYPLQDLCLDISFINKVQKFYQEVNEELLNIPANKNIAIFGAPHYELNERNLPHQIYNGLFTGKTGQACQLKYIKRLLPNYDIFDELKYFTPGRGNAYLEVDGKTFALLICEDMWHTTVHQIDPIKRIQEEILEKSISLDGIINISASPYGIGKKEQREQRANEIAQTLQAPFIYVNSSGLHDEILFDGQSFIYDGEEFNTLPSFQEALGTFELPAFKQSMPQTTHAPIIEEKNTWEDLFAPRLTTDGKLQALTSDQCQEVIDALVFSIHQYATKCGFDKITIALSGGIDSALVLAIAHLVKEKYNFGLEALFMPGHFTSSESYELSRKMCDHLGISMKNFPIKFLHQTIRHTYNDIYSAEMTGLADENIQSRLRGALLYARSNAENSLVINTSNKSELAVGYSTIYGDSVGAFSILGDLYKTEVFALSQHLQGLIPQEIINRPPSAELRDNQKDEDSLPPYDRLDAIIEGLLSYQLSAEDLEKSGLPSKEITDTQYLIRRSEYKRFQFCPIIKLKNKSFGFGRRIPILKR